MTFWETSYFPDILPCQAASLVGEVRFCFIGSLYIFDDVFCFFYGVNFLVLLSAKKLVGEEE